MTIVRADDWMALYDANGLCVYQGHSIADDELLRLSGVEVQTINAQGQADELGCFPDELYRVCPDYDQ